MFFIFYSRVTSTFGQRSIRNGVDRWSDGAPAVPWGYVRTVRTVRTDCTVRVCRWCCRWVRPAAKKAVEEGFDTVLVDTAGRQVVDDNLMDELRRIKEAGE